jgi:hypothetical protein
MVNQLGETRPTTVVTYYTKEGMNLFFFCEKEGMSMIHGGPSFP